MNNSGNITMHRHLFDSTLNTTIDAIYITISVAIVICNSLICLMFYKDKSLRRPFYILLLNLSLADMASAFTIQPYIWIDFSKLGGNSAAGFLCASSVGMVFFISSSITNSLTVSAIAVFRYLGIVRNYQGRIVTSNTIAGRFCVITWVIGGGANIPIGQSFQYNEIEATCYSRWPNKTYRDLYLLLTIFLFHAIPTIIMIVCYAALVVHIWKRSLDTQGQNITAVRARKSVAVLVGFLILALILCWTPMFIIWILGSVFTYFTEGTDSEYERQRWLRVAAIFALLNSVLNPFIYTFSSKDYRKSVMQWIFASWRRKISVSSSNAAVGNKEYQPTFESNWV